MNKTLKVRLSVNQIETIKKLSKEFFNSDDIWIFGSRADLTQRGGDIDIYIQSDKKSTLRDKIAFLREFEKEFGEQKVDLVVDNKTIEKEIFKIAKSSGVKL